MNTYAIAIGIVESLELDDVGMTDYAHDLQLTILWIDMSVGRGAEENR